MPSADWSRLWRRAGWLRRLYGRMHEPSTADAGVDAWMASLAVSRANPIASRESASGPMTSATSGPLHAASSSRPDPAGSSSKTRPGSSRRSPASFRVRSESAETYTAWVTRLRADFSARKAWALATSASGSSSSGSGASARPTPQTRDHKGANQDEMFDGEIRKGAAPLNEEAVIWQRKRWPTPNATDGDKAPNCFSRGLDNPSVPYLAKGWTASREPSASTRSMPRASDGEKGGPNQAFGAGGVPLPAQADRSTTGLALPAQATKWQTPRVSMGAYTRDNGDPDKERLSLDGQARRGKWPTPQAHDSMTPKTPEQIDRMRREAKPRAGGGPPGVSNLNEVASMWCTPSVAISTGGQSSRSGDRQGEELLTGQARSLFTHLDPMTSTDGEPSSPSDPSSPPLSLNPFFVGWLMGWTVPASTNSGFSEMGSFRWRALMRSALSRIALPPAAPPVQTDLFG